MTSDDRSQTSCFLGTRNSWLMNIPILTVKFTVVSYLTRWFIIYSDPYNG